MFWNTSLLESVYIKTHNPVLCRQKSSFFHWGYSSKQWRIVPDRPLLGSIRCIPSRVTASGYIFRSTFWSLSLCSDECRTKKAFQHVKIMLPLFRAVAKFCTTNKLFKYLLNFFLFCLLTCLPVIYSLLVYQIFCI